MSWTVRLTLAGVFLTVGLTGLLTLPATARVSLTDPELVPSAQLGLSLASMVVGGSLLVSVLYGSRRHRRRLAELEELQVACRKLMERVEVEGRNKDNVPGLETEAERWRHQTGLWLGKNLPNHAERFNRTRAQISEQPLPGLLSTAIALHHKIEIWSLNLDAIRDRVAEEGP